jgi:hypothetical protein
VFKHASFLGIREDVGDTRGQALEARRRAIARAGRMLKADRGYNAGLRAESRGLGERSRLLRESSRRLRRSGSGTARPR